MAKRKQYMKKYFADHRAIRREKAKALYRSDPKVRKAASERYRLRPDRHATHLKHKFGLSVAEYDSMVVAQCGLCAICGKPETRKQAGSPLPCRLSVDHDHTSGKRRALLCAACNTSIGKMHEDPTRLRAAATYLEFHKGAQ